MLVGVLVLLSLLTGCFCAPDVVVAETSLVDVIARSALVANCSGDGEAKLLLRLLSDIVRAPGQSRAPRAHEMERANAERFIRTMLKRYPSIDKGNMAPWLRRANSFLSAYASGTWQLKDIDPPVSVNFTALSGLPVVRRVLLAQLVTAWLTVLGRRLPEEAQPQLEIMAKQLYDIHRQSVEERGAMEYFHISKSGGTSWNAAARNNGCVYPVHSPGYHVKGFDDGCRWVNQTEYRRASGRGVMWGRWGQVSRSTEANSCWRRYARVVSDSLSYLSNEYTLHGGGEDMYDTHVCPQLVNVVTLREPIRRMTSNVRFIMLNAKRKRVRRVDDKKAGAAAFAAAFCNSSRGFWEALSPPVTDNYIVRSFLGERGFHTPLGGVGPEAVAVARALLLRFDLVLDLDSGTAATDRAMFQGMRWPATLAQAHRLNSHAISERMSLNFSECFVNPADWEALLARQGPDVQLYSFGRVLTQLDALWLDLARVPDQPPAGLNLTDPAQIQCGLLRRRSDGSVLAGALGLASNEQQAGVSGGADDGEEEDGEDEGDGGEGKEAGRRGSGKEDDEADYDYGEGDKAGEGAAKSRKLAR